MTKARKFWLDTMLKIILPVLEPLAEDRLKEVLPIEGKKTAEEYKECTYLEAFGRIVAGISPWLGLNDVCEEEKLLQQKVIRLIHKGLENATDPEKNDFMNFTKGGQPIVDTAFLAQGILRVPHILWEPLSKRVKENVINAMKKHTYRKALLQ